MKLQSGAHPPEKRVCPNAAADGEVRSRDPRHEAKQTRKRRLDLALREGGGSPQEPAGEAPSPVSQARGPAHPCRAQVQLIREHAARLLILPLCCLGWRLAAALFLRSCYYVIVIYCHSLRMPVTANAVSLQARTQRLQRFLGSVHVYCADVRGYDFGKQGGIFAGLLRTRAW